MTVDASGLKEGDYAGICALQGCYGMVAVTRKKDGCYIVMKGRSLEEDSPLGRQGEGFQETEWESVRAGQDVVRLRVKADFFKMKDEAEFFYHHGNGWKQIGVTQKLHFGLDHFAGCRFGLFLYATKETGGRAGFSDFLYCARPET